MLDIDHFKKINDTYGHLVGDEVLKGLSKILQKYLRESDIVARWGGEEFVILLPRTNKRRALKVAEQLQKYIKRLQIDEVGHITCSFGVTQFKNGDDKDSVFKRLDMALYEAKISGRDCIIGG